MNYSALRQPVDPNEAKVVLGTVDIDVDTRSLIFEFVMVSVVLATLGSVLFGYDRGAVAGIFVAAAVVATHFSVRSLRASRSLLLDLYRLKLFADTNGGVFRRDAQTVERGVMFHLGNERTMLMQVQFEGNKDMPPFSLGTMEYVYLDHLRGGRFAPEYKRLDTKFQFGFVKIEMEHQLPNMILDTKDNDVFSAVVRRTTSVKQRVEGNFNDTFTLYVPQGGERDALFLLTPDVMQTLLDQASSCDIELVDRSIYLYFDEAIDVTESKLRNIETMVKRIYQEVSKQAQGLNRSKDAATIQVLVSSITKPRIRAWQFVRTNPRVLVGVLAIIIAALYIVPTLYF